MGDRAADRVVNSCLQLYGGYGYMDEYPTSRAFADARVQTLVGGSTEIMKQDRRQRSGRPATRSARLAGAFVQSAWFNCHKIRSTR